MLQGLLGISAFILIAFVLSENKSKFLWKQVAIGVFLQIGVALLFFNVGIFKQIFVYLNKVILVIEEATNAGTSFVFGYLGGGPLPFAEPYPGASFIFAFKALPIILVMSALSSVLYYWRVLPIIIKGFSFIFRNAFNMGGPEAFGVSANIFVGMVESPLFIRPYLAKMTRSEIFTLMTCGMATIAGTVIVLYASILKAAIPDILGHILIASIISVPASITIARIMVPETGQTSGEIISDDPSTNTMDAIAKGTSQGLHLLLNVIAMLVVLVSLIHLVNIIIGTIPMSSGEPLTLQKIAGIIMAPLVWLMGVPWSESVAAGKLMGLKTILNEFLAYLELSKMTGGELSEKSKIIMTYALCGFANPGSLGIMLGGLISMAPERKDEFVSLGIKSLVAGTLATSMTGAVVGIILSI